MPRSRADDLDELNVSASPAKHSAPGVNTRGNFARASTACSSHTRVYKLRHSICSIEPALVESNVTVIMAKASPCTCAYNKTITTRRAPHTHYIIDETNSREEFKRTNKKTEYKCFSSQKIYSENQLHKLLNTFQAHCKPFTSMFNVKNLSEYFSA
jgi:hypothetical protein